MPLHLDTCTPLSLSERLTAVQDCTVCARQLPHAPRPVFRISPTARILIVGQAPGRRVHETGIPWNDASGDRLRAWLDLSREQFYDMATVAIVPMGLCYPGTAKGGDLPPRRECAPLWHPLLHEALRSIRLTLLIGAYAQAYYLGRHQGRTLTDNVAAWRDCAAGYFPLPHPSPRNGFWFKRHPWFESTVVPAVRKRVGAVLTTGDNGATSS